MLRLTNYYARYTASQTIYVFKKMFAYDVFLVFKQLFL